MITRIRQLLASKFIRVTLVLQVGSSACWRSASLVGGVWRLMGPQAYGVFALAQSFLIIWRRSIFPGSAPALPRASRWLSALAMKARSSIYCLLRQDQSRRQRHTDALDRSARPAGRGGAL